MAGPFPTAKFATKLKARPVASMFVATAFALTCMLCSSAAPAEQGSGSVDPQTGNFVVYVYPEGHFSEESDIQKMLAGWASAAAQNNVDTESRYYAPEVGRYFLRRNVSNAFVRHDKEALRERGYELHSFTIKNVDIELASETEANVSLVKSWVIARGDTAQRADSTRSHLTLRRTPSGWKIVGEQDLKPNS